MGMGPFEMWQFNLVIYSSLKKTNIKKHVAVPVCSGFALTLGGERCL